MKRLNHVIILNMLVISGLTISLDLCAKIAVLPNAIDKNSPEYLQALENEKQCLALNYYND